MERPYWEKWEEVRSGAGNRSEGEPDTPLPPCIPYYVFVTILFHLRMGKLFVVGAIV